MSDAKIENVELTELQPGEARSRVVSRQNLDVVKDVTVRLTAVLGSASLSVGEMFALQESSVIKLDALADQPVELILDGQVVARGSLVIADDHFGVQVTEVPNAD